MNKNDVEFKMFIILMRINPFCTFNRVSLINVTFIKKIKSTFIQQAARKIHMAFFTSRAEDRYLR